MSAARLLVVTLALIASATATDLRAQTAQGVPATAPARAVGLTHDCSNFYPPGAARLNHSGSVLIQYDVEADGRLTHIVVAKSSGFSELDRAALSCVAERWRDLPARRAGIAVASPRHQALIQFELVDSVPAPRSLDISALRRLETSPSTNASSTGDTGNLDALTFLVWSFGPLAVLAWLVRWTRLWIFRRRDCASCGARNRGIVPFVDAGYCSSCGVKFARAA